MAASQGPPTRTESTCTTETARATHVFRIAGYSLQRGIGPGRFLRSASFAVGGHEWAVRFYPDGDNPKANKGYVSVYLELRSKGTEVRAIYDFRLVDPTTGRSSPVFSQKTAQLFRSFVPHDPCCGTGRFMKRSKLEASRYLQEDCLVIECDVIVIKEFHVVETAMTVAVQEKPSDLLDNLEKLLGPEDVTFKVKGEVFHAHKLMLSLRSPVLKAAIYGPTRNNKRWCINVKDMEPYVFKALLHFIYTDLLPDMDGQSGDDEETMAKHLLVAADRYGMERLKSICVGILCKRFGVDSVAITTSALADRYHCSKLKDARNGFINSLDGKGMCASKEHVRLSPLTCLRKQLSRAKSRMCILS